MFNAVYVNFAECYGPDGSLPLRQALEALVGVEDVETYRSEGFALIHCPVKNAQVAVHDGDAVALGPDGRVIVLEDIEAFRQEVSDEIQSQPPAVRDYLGHFIIPAPKPDLLVEAMKEIGVIPLAGNLRSALEARGLEIREKGQ